MDLNLGVDLPLVTAELPLVRDPDFPLVAPLVFVRGLDLFGGVSKHVLKVSFCFSNLLFEFCLGGVGLKVSSELSPSSSDTSTTGFFFAAFLLAGAWAFFGFFAGEGSNMSSEPSLSTSESTKFLEDLL